MTIYKYELGSHNTWWDQKMEGLGLTALQNIPTLREKMLYASSVRQVSM